MLLIHKINVSQIISLCSLIVWLRLVLGRLVDSCDDWMTNVLETLMEVIIRVASTPLMISPMVVKLLVITTNNSPPHDEPHLDNQTSLLNVSPRFKPIKLKVMWIVGCTNFTIKEEGNRIKSVSVLVLQFHSNFPTNLSCSSEKFSARSGISEPFTWMRFARLKIFTCRYHYRKIKWAFSFTFKWIGFKKTYTKSVNP